MSDTEPIAKKSSKGHRTRSFRQDALSFQKHQECRRDLLLCYHHYLVYQPLCQVLQKMWGRPA
ncbi:MAG: hypothetical protein PHW87_05040 [Methanothrix sp.]|nr:hypothetical protein [Methanothrix sp.]